jgi:hypothetical protein
VRDLRPSACGAARVQGRTHDAPVLVLAQQLGVHGLAHEAPDHPLQRRLRAGLFRFAEVLELGRVDARDTDMERAILELYTQYISPLPTYAVE